MCPVSLKMEQKHVCNDDQQSSSTRQDQRPEPIELQEMNSSPRPAKDVSTATAREITEERTEGLSTDSTPSASLLAVSGVSTPIYAGSPNSLQPRIIGPRMPLSPMPSDFATAASHDQESTIGIQAGVRQPSLKFARSPSCSGVRLLVLSLSVFFLAGFVAYLTLMM